MREALVHRNLNAVVVGVLIGFDDPDVAVHRAGCRRTVVVNAAVERAAIVDRRAGIGIAASLGGVSATGTRDAACGDVELRAVDVVVKRSLAVQRTDIVDAHRCASAKLLLNTEIELDGIRPAVVRVEGYVLGERKECCNALLVIEKQAWVGVWPGWELGWIAGVRVGQRNHLAVAAIAHGVWRVVRRKLPFVAGN